MLLCWKEEKAFFRKFPSSIILKIHTEIKNFFQVYSFDEINHTGFSLQPSEVNTDISTDFCGLYIMMFLFQDRPADDTIQNYN